MEGGKRKMIERYQELLNECIDLQEDKEMAEDMKLGLNILKGELERCR